MTSIRSVVAKPFLLALLGTIALAVPESIHGWSLQKISPQPKAQIVKFDFSTSWRGRVGGRFSAGEINIVGQFESGKLEIKYEEWRRFGNKKSLWRWQGTGDDVLYKQCLEILRQTHLNRPPKTGAPLTERQNSSVKGHGFTQSETSVTFIYADGVERTGYPSTAEDWFKLGEALKIKAGSPRQTDRQDLLHRKKMIT